MSACLTPGDDDETDAVESSLATCRGSRDENASAYPTNDAIRDRSGTFHKAWVWRDTPDVATNHDIFYARSADMKTWTKSDGTPVALPITRRNGEMAKAICAGSGLMNNIKLGLDPADRPVVSYMRFDANGKTQVYNLRREGTGWKEHVATRWTVRHDLSGKGSLPSSATSVGFSAIRITEDGKLVQQLGRAAADATGTPTTGTYELDAASLAPVRPYVEPAALRGPARPASWNTVESVVPGMKVRSLAAREETSWIALRGHWDGGAERRRGFFDAVEKKFYLDRANGTTQVVAFGHKTTSYEFVIGDWDGDGVDTVGLRDPATGRYFLRNSNTSGVADVTVDDAEFRAHYVALDGNIRQRDVGDRFFVKWETLDANNDKPRDCTGDGEPDGASRCSKYVSTLYAYELIDPTTKPPTWHRTSLGAAWAGTSVGFDYLFYRNRHVVLYYDGARRMAVAFRSSESNVWTKASLANVFAGWDSHNYVVAAIDDSERIHVSGNVHASPLVYFCSQNPLDPTSFEPKPMTGRSEPRTTYPHFFRGKNGAFLFTVREGGSGDGSNWYNVYDDESRTWTGLGPKPLFGN